MLSDEQIDFIDNDLRSRGIEMDDLRAGLLDHICCLIEVEMKNSDDFEIFYNNIIRRFYKKELKEIENETQLLLIYKNYYSMKKTMFVSGIFSSIGFVFGGLLKFMHWPGASALLIVGFASFALIFLPVFLFLKVSGNSIAVNRIQLIISLLVGVAAVMGALFKIMHWPFASVMMNGSFIVFLFVFIPAYFFPGIRDGVKRQSTIINTFLFIAIAGILFSMVNLSGSRNYDLSIVQTDELIIKNLKYLKYQPANLISDSAEYMEKERIDAINFALQITDEVIEKIRTAAGSENSVPASFESISLNNSFDFSNHVLFYQPESGSRAYAFQLRKAFESVDQFVREENQKIVNDNLPDANGEKQKWENNFLKNNTVAVAVRKLQLLKLRLSVMKAVKY